MADMAKSATCLPYSYSRDWGEQPRYVINAHSALFKMAAAGITKRLRSSSLKIDKKKITSLGKAFFNIGSTDEHIRNILSNTCKNGGVFL